MMNIFNTTHSLKNNTLTKLIHKVEKWKKKETFITVLLISDTY